MCDIKNFNHLKAGENCCCNEVMFPPHFRRHHSSFKPVFPAKKEQVEILKEYKQKLNEEIDEIEKRIKDLE